MKYNAMQHSFALERSDIYSYIYIVLVDINIETFTFIVQYNTKEYNTTQRAICYIYIALVDTNTDRRRM